MKTAFPFKVGRGSETLRLGWKNIVGVGGATPIYWGGLESTTPITSRSTRRLGEKETSGS